jgi:hypothetical protein
MSTTPVTGLSGLGSAIAGAGADYLGRTRQLQDESRRRGYQLEDVQSARAYSDTVRKEERSARLEDQKTIDERRARQVMITTLQAEGLLAPGRENDDAAVAAAYEEARRRGLDKLYQELFSTPGPDGKPLLTQADISDPTKIQAAKDALGKLKADQLKFGMDQRGNAQSTVNQIYTDLAQIRAQKENANRVVSAPAPHYGPESPEVIRYATQMATKPGGGRPSREDIAAAIPQAQKDLNGQALIEHAQRQQAARAELDSLRYSEAEKTNVLEKMTGTFKIAPSNVGTSVLQQPTPVAATPKAATADQMAAAMDAVFGKAPTPAAAGASPGAVALANPTSDPLIAQENQRRSTETWRTTLADPFNVAMDRVDKINSEIQRVREGRPPANAPAPGIFGGPPDLYSNPTIQANSLSALYVELEKAKADAEKARRAMLGVPSVPKPAAAPATAGAVLSNPVNGVAPTAPGAPAWWQPQTPVPAMGF